MSNSFITNVNTLVDNLSAVYTANEKLTPEVINQLTTLNLAQLQAVYVELAKIVDVQANMSSVVTTAGAIESIVTLANYLDAASAPSIVEDLILINSKLDALTASVDFLTETITGLGSAQLAIESQSSPVFADIPTVPTIMPFNVETPSSNTDIISTDALQDTITFKLNGSYTFTSNVSVTSKTNATVALTFKIVDIATGNVLATESNTVHISKHSTATLPLTTLLTISNAPVTVRVEAQSTASGYELTAFNSLLVSSVTVGLPDIYAERLYVVEKDSSTGAANLPSGSTAERPDTAELGAIRYNTDINEYEGYTDSGWESLAAGATGSNGDNVFLITDKVMTNDYTVPENKRAVAFGDVELIGDLTIPNNSELLVLGDYKDGMVVVNNISKLSTVNTSVSTNVAVKSYHNGLEGGGGVFYYDSTKPRTEHNGGTVIAPNAVFPSDWNDQVQLAAWFDGSSLTGNGCWVRSYDGAVNVKWFGAKGDGVADDRACIQSCLDSNITIYVPSGIFRITRPLEIPSNILLFGEGENSVIQNTSVMNQDGVTNYIDTAVVLPKSNKPGINYSNISSFGERVAFKDYKAGEFLRLPKPIGSYYSGQLVIIESSSFVGDYPQQSFITEISEVGDTYVSFKTSYGFDIPHATLRDMEEYAWVRNTHIKDIKLKGSYYVGHLQFGLVGGYPSYKCTFTNVYFDAGIGYSTNSMNDTVFDNCKAYSEYTGIEGALLSSNVVVKNCEIIQRAGFASDAFGVNGDKSSEGVMFGEGSHGIIINNNVIKGNWNRAIHLKYVTTPFSVTNNRCEGFGYFGISFTGGGGEYVTDISNNYITGGFASPLTYGISLDPNVNGYVSKNIIDVSSFPIISNQGKFTLDGNTFLTTTLPPRIRLASWQTEQIRDYIKHTKEAEFIKPKFLSSLATTTLTNVKQEIYWHNISPYINQNGAVHNAEAALFFGGSQSREITVDIGEVSRTFTVLSTSVHINVFSYTYSDSGTVGMGGGRIIYKDGDSEEVVIDFTGTYPQPIFSSNKGFKISVTGYGVVRPMWFRSEVENSPAWIEIL